LFLGFYIRFPLFEVKFGQRPKGLRFRYRTASYMQVPHLQAFSAGAFKFRGRGREMGREIVDVPRVSLTH
jgi:hypothetical protein